MACMLGWLTPILFMGLTYGQYAMEGPFALDDHYAFETHYHCEFHYACDIHYDIAVDYASAEHCAIPVRGSMTLLCSMSLRGIVALPLC